MQPDRIQARSIPVRRTAGQKRATAHVLRGASGQSYRVALKDEPTRWRIAVLGAELVALGRELQRMAGAFPVRAAGPDGRLH